MTLIANDGQSRGPLWANSAALMAIAPGNAVDLGPFRRRILQPDQVARELAIAQGFHTAGDDLENPQHLIPIVG